MKTIQEMLQELSQCIVTVSGEFRFRTNWNGGKVPQPDLDVFDPNVPFCIENVGDVKASIQYNTKNTNIRISKDYKNWNDYTSGTEIELNPKDRVYIKSDYVKDTGYNPRFVFNGDGTRLRARGNIASLIYGTNDAYVNKYTSTEERCYYSMFKDCKSLVQAPVLPATTLAESCYYYMFYGCTSLTQAPELPATTLADNCYNRMFNGCTSLTQAPELPATILTYECYSRMFDGCTSLTSAPELPATNLFTRCYNAMFNGCTSLTQAPTLPAMTLGYGCYQFMFEGCTSLTQAPELPATTLAESCYGDMFRGCTSLTQAPDLPATKLADYCYRRMFQGCTSLTQAPELPATALYISCYESMFNGCTSLTQAPELPATTLANYCYNSMFYNCKKLNYVKCLATDTSATNCTKDWLSGVSSTGTFECDNKKYFTLDSPNGIPTGWSITEINPAQPEPEKPDLDTFDPNVPFCIENVGETQASIQYNTKNTNIKISKDYKTWNDYTTGDSITLDPTDRVYIKSDYVKDTGSSPRFVFNGDGAQLRARGNISSLIYGTNDVYVNKYTSTEEYCYRTMFQGCKSLVQAPELPATTLAQSCYHDMFEFCVGLTQAPELPATTLAYYCYFGMFSNCTGLTQTPELPATTLANSCYYYMFFRCTKLNHVKCLATDTSAIDCTRAWLSDVSSTGTFECDNKKYFTLDSSSGIPVGWTITEINPDIEKPDLDVFDPNVPFCIENVGETQASVQYNTKNTNIRISKDYKTWNDYTTGDPITLDPTERVYIKSDYVKDTGPNPRFVFNGDGIRLRARGNIASLIYGTDNAYVNKYTSTEEYCYFSMFYDCASLIQAPELPATILVTRCYYYMFRDCTGLTQAPELPATTLASNCYQYMFTGCRSLTRAPELPATTLPSYCYEGMFDYCTSLTQAPELPATTLGWGCYYGMFKGCRSLNQAPELPATTLANSCYFFMFYDCKSLTQAPELPATTLTDGCYWSMFQGCTGLTQAPDLPATTLANNCYKTMFSGCNKLNYVKCLATDTSATDCTTNWLSNVSATGTFECDNKKYFTLDSPNGIPVGWTIAEINPDVEKPDLDTFDPNVPFCIENVGDVPVEIGMYNYSEAVRTNCEISYDLQTWQNYNLPITQDANSTTISKITLTNKGDRVYIKADLVANPGSCSTITVFNKSSTKKIRARGNIASLNKGANDAYKTDYLTTDSYCYNNLFSDCGLSLTQAPDLPATTLNDNCYSNMFHGCTQLVNAPELPATTLAYMCYSNMFSGCTSLTQAPVLPAITLANYCYSGMFQGCTSLTKAPELSATKLSIVCYSNMFKGCTKLNYVKCLATDISAANCTASWLEGVSATGDFYAPVTTRWTTNSYSGIPSGWTRHNV